jgi:hypothetical protein
LRYSSAVQIYKRGENNVKKRSAVVCVIALLTMNCGSIIHQTTQQVHLSSEPAGAAITVACGDINNDPKLVTPAVVTLHRKPSYCGIKLNKEGYAEKELKFGRQMSGWYLGNVVFGGIIGLIVDAANGAMWQRTTPTNATEEKGEVKVQLEPATSSASNSQ